MSDEHIRRRVREILLAKAVENGKLSKATAGAALSGGAKLGGTGTSPSRRGEKGKKKVAGGDWASFADAFQHGPAYFFQKAGNEIVNPNSDLRAKIIPAAEQVAQVVAPLVGAGETKKKRKPSAHAMRVKAIMKKNPGMKLGEASKLARV